MDAQKRPTWNWRCWPGWDFLCREGVPPATCSRDRSSHGYRPAAGDITFGNSYRCDVIAFDPKKYDVGVAGGGGIEIGLTDTLDVGVGILYTLGLLDISKNAPVSFERKNRTLTLRAGLSFPIG